ncbi:proteinase-activated receptor 3-like [Anser cygnoides]|uniref:proteinase-activated receptor 3-like n=1 Tax=Anser cygnoides TaxID=8845 RepID=UPI0034D1CD99
MSPLPLPGNVACHLPAAVCKSSRRSHQRLLPPPQPVRAGGWEPPRPPRLLPVTSPGGHRRPQRPAGLLGTGTACTHVAGEEEEGSRWPSSHGDAQRGQPCRWLSRGRSSGGGHPAEMSLPVTSPGVAATFLISLATQLPVACGKGRVLRPLTPQEEAECPSASVEAFLNSTMSTRVLPALYSVVLLVALPANAVACWVLVVNFRRCSSSLFLLNLASADLLFVLLLPFKICYHLLGNHWLFGDYLCRATVALFYGNMYGSILFLTCIGLERYISVVHPFVLKGSRWTWGRAGICVGIWLLVGLGVSPLLFYPQTKHSSLLNITTCHDVLGKDEQKFFDSYFLSLVGLGFGVPFVLMTISYSCILARLLAKHRNYRHVVCVLAVVFLVFILCFTPSNVLLFIHYLLQDTVCSNTAYIWYALALAFSAFNNCFDPFIYFYVSRDFRGWLRNSCCPQRLRTRRGWEKAASCLRSSEQTQL